MQSLRVTGPQTFSLVEIDEPEPDAGHVLVEFRFATICGSDVPKYTGTWDEFPLPLLPGMPIHECVGDVVASATPALPVGSTVLAMPAHDAGLAERFVAHESQVHELGSWDAADLPYACLGQPAGAVLYGLDRIGDVEGRRVLIVGLGGIGAICAILLAARGAADIVAIEPNRFRRELAERRLGIATYPGWVDAPQDYADITIEAVSHHLYSETLPLCVRVTRPEGRLLLLGVPSDASACLPVKPLVRRKLTAVGSIAPPWQTYLGRGAAEALSNLSAFRWLVTDRLPWRSAQAAFDATWTPTRGG